ncbi:MAG TPA: hypothetical protein VN633_13780 [Bryobacteraceae bacterium]|nr:hypothetical protein [Bryobacteraceae bacterium]
MRILGFVVQYAVFVLLWLFFSAQPSGVEIFAALIASAITLLGLQAALRALPLCFKPKLRWFFGIWRLPGLIANDLWVLLVFLIRRIAGQAVPASMEQEPFNAQGDDPRASAQRALGVLFMSIAPNAIAIHIERARCVMLFHQLQRAPTPLIVKQLMD